MPFGQIRDLPTAIGVVDRAGHPAGGLILDTRHTMWQFNLADRGGR